MIIVSLLGSIGTVIGAIFAIKSFRSTVSFSKEQNDIARNYPIFLELKDFLQSEINAIKQKNTAFYDSVTVYNDDFYNKKDESNLRELLPNNSNSLDVICRDNGGYLQDAINDLLPKIKGKKEKYRYKNNDTTMLNDWWLGKKYIERLDEIKRSSSYKIFSRFIKDFLKEKKIHISYSDSLIRKELEEHQDKIDFIASLIASDSDSGLVTQEYLNCIFKEFFELKKEIDEALFKEFYQYIETSYLTKCTTEIDFLVVIIRFESQFFPLSFEKFKGIVKTFINNFFIVKENLLQIYIDHVLKKREQVIKIYTEHHFLVLKVSFIENKFIKDNIYHDSLDELVKYLFDKQGEAYEKYKVALDLFLDDLAKEKGLFS